MSKAAADTLEKVSTEFEAEVLSDLQAGRDEATKNLDSIRRQTAEEVERALDSGAKQAESVKRQVIGAAELDVRNAHLRSLEKAVNEVFDAAVRRVSSLSGPDSEKALTTLIREGLDIIGPRARVLSSPSQKKVVSSAIRKLSTGSVKLTLEEKEIETIGGVMLTTADGTVKFDNTFEARLERMRPALRKEVAGILTAS